MTDSVLYIQPDQHALSCIAFITSAVCIQKQRIKFSMQIDTKKQEMSANMSQAHVYAKMLLSYILK